MEAADTGIRLMLSSLVWILVLVHTLGEYSCPPHWHLYGDECILINSSWISSWPHARDACRTIHNGTMLNIDSQEKNEFIDERIHRTYWIGLHRVEEGGMFVWSDTNRQPEYTRWQWNEPNDGQENCAIMKRNSGNWNDISCEARRAYVCHEDGSSAGCRSGWVRYIAECYRWGPGSKTWAAARLACQNLGGDLPVLLDQEQNNFLRSYAFAFRGHKSVWIGYNDMKKEGNWVWLDEGRIDPDAWTYWDYGQPDNMMVGSFQDCACLLDDSGGKWKVRPCLANYAVVCEKPANTVATVDVAAGSNISCVDGWALFGESCYMFDPLPASWGRARDRCQALGSDLVVLNDGSENNYLAGLITQHSWLGLTDRDADGVWSWLDNITQSTYSHWQTEPRLPQQQFNCVDMYATSDKVGKWTNARCTQKNAYICEADRQQGSGDDAWLQYGDSYYKRFMDVVDWETARDNCRNAFNSSDLLVVDDEDEQTFINSQIAGELSVPGFWNGINSLQERYHFVALDSNREVNWTNWAVGEPHYVEHESCGLIAGGGKWQDKFCKGVASLICQKPAEGEPSYYDFRYDNNIYKLVDGEFISEEGDTYCQNTFGDNTSLAAIETQDQLDRLIQEIQARRLIDGSIRFWISTPGGNLTNTNAPSSAGSTYIGGQPGCTQLKTRRRGRRKKVKFVLYLKNVPCCEGASIVCQKTLGDASAWYDFRYKQSVYKIMTKRLDKTDAEEACSHTSEGGGWLLEVNSHEELDVISRELVIRHLGEDLEYWVYGNITDNVTRELMSTDNNVTDGECLMLTHPRFLNHEAGDKLVMSTSECDVTKHFICEQYIFTKDPATAGALRAPVEAPSASDGKFQNSAGGCQVLCISLLVLYPFVVVPVIFLIYKYHPHLKRIPSLIRSRKAVDELQLVS